MANKSKKRKNDYSKFRDEVIRHFDVVSEQMDKKWDLVAEQYYGIAQRLKDLEQRMERHGTIFTEIKIDLKFIKDDIAALKPLGNSEIGNKQLEILEKRVAALEKARK